MSKSIYSKLFSNYSPFFPILLVAIIIYSVFLRSDILKPVMVLNDQIQIWSKFGFSHNFITSNIQAFYNIEFFVSLLSIILVFILGTSLIGKTAGLFMSAFIGLYPYYIVNTFSAETISLFFFILYLTFLFQASTKYSKLFSVFSGISFMIAFICNPVCLFLGLVIYAYQAVCIRNIAVLYNFLAFIGGAFIPYIIYMIFISRLPGNAQYIPAFSSIFTEFMINFNQFLATPWQYTKDVIIPLFTQTLAYPASYSAELKHLYYWHYAAVFSSVLGLLYSLIDEKARIITIMAIIILIEAFFMPINFGLLFLFVILIGSYLIDRTFNDVFC